MTRNGTLPTRISAPTGSSLAEELARGGLADQGHARRARSTAAASKYSPRATPRSQTRSRALGAAHHAGPWRSRRRAAPGASSSAWIGSQVSTPGSARDRRDVVEGQPRRVGARAAHQEAAAARDDDGRRRRSSWRTVARIFRSAPRPTETTSVSAATPTRRAQHHEGAAQLVPRERAQAVREEAAGVHRVVHSLGRLGSDAGDRSWRRRRGARRRVRDDPAALEARDAPAVRGHRRVVGHEHDGPARRRAGPGRSP